jgi:hypothetical protein
VPEFLQFSWSDIPILAIAWSILDKDRYAELLTESLKEL